MSSDFFAICTRDTIEMLEINYISMPGMSERAFRGWESPEEEWNAKKNETLSFDQRVKMIMQNAGDSRILKDAQLLEDITGLKDIHDEKECEEIAKKHNLDAAMISAIALRAKNDKLLN